MTALGDEMARQCSRLRFTFYEPGVSDIEVDSLRENYRAWLITVPTTITADSLWKMRAYRLALFLSDLIWIDVGILLRDRRTIGIADQLFRAVGSIGANIAEGYSRSSNRERARFYEYSLGSAREARDWLFKARHILPGDTALVHIELTSELIRLLLTMVPNQRGRFIAEEPESYDPFE